MESRRSRYPYALRWLFGFTIVVMVSSMIFTSGGYVPSGPSRPYQPGVSKVFASNIYVSPEEATANAKAQNQPSGGGGTATPTFAGGPTPTFTPYTLSGRVSDSNNGVLATVVLTGTDVYTTNTDVNGNYSIAVPGGLYLVAAIPTDHCIGAPQYELGITQDTHQDFEASRKLDQFGHTCYTEAGNWVTASNLVPFGSGEDQEYTTALPAGLDFRLYGGPETTLNILQNGFVTFGDRGTSDSNIFLNDFIPNVSNPNNAIYAWWDIMEFDVSGTGVYTSYDSANKKFTIEWRMKLQGHSTYVNYEIVLQGGLVNNTSGNFWLNYQEVGSGFLGSGASGTVGVESLPDPALVPLNSDALEYSFNEAVLHNGLSVHFYLPPQGTIVGRVRDKHTPNRIPMAANVQLLNTSRRFNTAADTGLYTMTVSTGDYTLQASARRYTTETTQVTVQANTVISVPDILLGSPVVDPNPGGFTDMWVVAGQTKQYTMTINNPGELDMPYVIREAIDHNGGGRAKVNDPNTVSCANNLRIDSAKTVYDSAQVTTSPGSNRHITYSFKTGGDQVAASPNISPSNILVYSDDSRSPYFDNTDDNTRVASQVPVRALCALGFQANATGVYNDPSTFWTLFNNGTHWDIVVIALEARRDFGGGQECNPNCGTDNYWPSLKAYYDGGGGRPTGKVVMSTWDVQGHDTGGNWADAADFYSSRLGGVFRAYDTFAADRPVFPWPLNSRDPFFSNPFTLTAATEFNPVQYSTTSLTYMDTNDIVGECKAGYNSLQPINGGCAVVASYDGRGVLASYRLSKDDTRRTFGPPYHPVMWWTNMIEQVVSPPIEFGDIPWISESPTTGMVPAGTVNNPQSVILSIDATSYTTRTTRPLSGYLYLGTNDPHIQPVGLSIPLSLTIILPNDPTPTPAPPPLVDLTVWSISAVNATNRADHPVVNVASAISVTVGNIGGLPGTSAFSVDIFYDLATAPSYGTRCDPVASPGCYQTLNALPAGQLTTVEFQHIFTTPGIHRVWVIVNTDGSQREPPNALGNNVGGADLCMATRPGQTFTDVGTSHFAYQQVEYLACRNVVTGLYAGHFGPNALTTRAQFSVMVAKGYGFPLITPVGGVQTFHDVRPNYYAYAYIETLYAQGIVGGYSQAQCGAAQAMFPCFLPNRNVTRAELSVFIWKAKAHFNPTWGGTPTGWPRQFSDVGPSNFAYNSIQILSYYRVVKGYTGGVYRPNSNGTRAELSIMLFNSLTRP